MANLMEPLMLQHGATHAVRHGAIHAATHGAPHAVTLMLLIRKMHANHATVPLMAPLILHYCHRHHSYCPTWRHSCCIAATQATFMLPHMAQQMLLYMTPLILQLMLLLCKAHATHAATHGAIHTALLPPKHHPSFHTWRYSCCYT